MNATAEIDAKLVDFLRGKLTFDRLVEALRVVESTSPNTVAERLRDFVNVGQLPPDLAPLILFDLGREMPAAEPDAR